MHATASAKRIDEAKYFIANRMEKSILVVGGKYGKTEKEVGSPTIWHFADVLHETHGVREGRNLNEYNDEVNMHLDITRRASIIAATARSGHPDGVALPGITSRGMSTVEEIRDERIWASEDPNGKTMIVRKIFSSSPHGYDFGEALIKSVIEFINIINGHGAQHDRIDNLLIFTRPNVYDGSPIETYHESQDPNLLLHKKMGGIYMGHYENACPEDKLAGGYMFKFDYSHLIGTGAIRLI